MLTKFNKRLKLMLSAAYSALLNPSLAKIPARRLALTLRHARRSSISAPHYFTPTTNLGEIVDRLSTLFPLLIIESDPNYTRIGIDSRELGRLKRIVDLLFDGDIWVAKKNNSTTIYMRSTKVLRIVIEQYDRVSKDRWISRNVLNRNSRLIYGKYLEEVGRHTVEEVVGVTADSLMSKTEIDVVYTWVNHEDPRWDAAFRKYLTNVARGDSDSSSMSRFHNSNELKYSLRSVWQHMPWVRKVIVFSNCRRPDWLIDHEKLVWVDHGEVIPSQYLPTFNSHVIESFLHRIPDLSEYFIYMNDDFFVANPISIATFFNAYGLSSSFLEPSGMVTGPPTEGDPDYLNASRESAALIRETFGFLPTQLHKHVPYALKRSLMSEIEDRFIEEFNRMRGNRFRGPRDLNLPSFFYHHYALAVGRASERYTESVLVRSVDIRWRWQLAQASAPSTEFFCLNEGGRDDLSHDWLSEITRFLERTYPIQAPWEA